MDKKCSYKTPTSADSLEQQIIDPSFPKNEREWWASEEITRLRAEVEALRAAAQAVAALLPGPYYMDPPDGGSVTVIEQLRRMAADAARYRWIKRGASFREERDMGPGGCWSIFVAVPRRPAVNSLDTAIDAAMAQGKV